MYDTLIRAVETYFDEIKVLKRGARGTVKLVRHRDTGKRYIFRCFDGSDEVYRRLLTVDCPYLPRIEEAAASRGRVAVLEEYVQGDTLLYLLEGSVLDWSEARKVTADICGALWVLHSMGAVHRDVKESNVILRGSDAVLIDFDASRIVKPEHPADTVILGTTGLCGAGAVWDVPDGRPGGYLLAGRTAERDADGAAPLPPVGGGPCGADRPPLYHDESRPAVPRCAGAAGRFVRSL